MKTEHVPFTYDTCPLIALVLEKTRINASRDPSPYTAVAHRAPEGITVFYTGNDGCTRGNEDVSWKEFLERFALVNPADGTISPAGVPEVVIKLGTAPTASPTTPAPTTNNDHERARVAAQIIENNRDGAVPLAARQFLLAYFK